MKHNFERIIGAKTPQEEEYAHSKLTEFKESDLPEKIMEASVEVTIEHQKIVQGVIAYAKKLLQSLGVEKTLPKLKLVLLNETKAVEAEILNKDIHGLFSPIAGIIAVVDTNDLVEFADTFAHEYFHALGYSSAQITDSEVIRSYRNGLSLRDRKDGNTRYFGDLEEALVTELSMKVLKDGADASIGSLDVQDKMEHMNSLREWFAQSRELRETLGEAEYLNKKDLFDETIWIPDIEKILPVLANTTISDSEKFSRFVDFSDARLSNIKTRPYEKERRKLKMIISEISKQHSNLSQEEVFNEFARAHFSGNYLPIARLIEATYGKGGFRDIANQTKRDPS